MTRARVEFPRQARVDIIRRATLPNRELQCERCKCQVRKGEIHHKQMDAMALDRKRKLTAADGEFLCHACHAKETKAQAPALAKAKRNEEKHIGAKAAPKQKIATRPKPEETKPDKLPMPDRRNIYG